jgi:phospholipase/lecithinase/hemolysin
MKTFAALGAACIALGFAAAPVHASRSTPQYTSLTVFGDSLVDAGNIAVYTGGTTPDPALGYFSGRFTNGYDYVDLLSIDLFGTPTAPSLLGGTNFAFGGARATTTSGVPDLSEQFAMFQGYLAGGGSIDTNGLYVLNFGGNDIFNLPDGYPTIDLALRAASASIAGAVQSLNDLGVRNIFVTDFPVGGAGLSFSLTANDYLTADLAGLTLDGDTTLMRFNYLDFLGRATLAPASVGLPVLDTTSNCIAANAQVSGCAGYFYFDGTHPTAQVQAAAYADMNRQFGLSSAVPEPASWAMMIAGFALAGASLRNRRSRMRIAFA